MSRISGRGARVTRHLRTLGSAALCAALALIWMVADAGMASAAGALAPAHLTRAADSPAQQAVIVDSPAVVRIVSVVNASLTCARCASDGSDIHSPSGSGVFTYYSSGSGAFITPTGAILTADHVVDHSMQNPEDVAFVEQQAAPDIATQYPSVTADQALQYLQNNPSKVTITFTVVFQKAFLSTAYTGPLPDTQHVYAFPIASIVTSSAVDKQDTAIVQIDTRGINPGPDFPYLWLSNRPVSALDNVTAIAFPADADLALNNADFTSLANVSGSDVNTINSLLSPSVNTGTITKANEIRPDGTPVYEASSIASNGSSGGPVINDHGEVIGFVDAGPVTDRLTFIIPSAVAETYLGQAGMSSVSEGRFMGMWTEAMGQYYSSSACHWTRAASDLKALKTQYPTFGGVAPYLAQASQNAHGETCPAGGASSPTFTGDVGAGLALIGGCVVAAFALILGVIFLVIALTRRRKRARPAPVYAAPAPTAAAPTATALPFPPGTRFCPNGHAVAETDAAFCPVCGVPMPGGAARG